METRAHYALIGAFALAVVVAAFGFVFWFSGADKTAARASYRLVFTSSVSGLSRGAFVTFNGLRVGEVTRIALGDDPRTVNAIIEIDPRTPVKSDTKARLESQGLTGVASVALTGGSLSAPTVEQASDGALPTIFAERSDLQNIVETLQNLSGKIDNLVGRADKIISDNEGSITATVKNVEVFSKSLADNTDGIKEIATNFASLGKSLRPFVETLEKNTDNIDATLKDTRELASKLSTAANKVEGFLVSAQNLFGAVGGSGSRGLVDDLGDAAKSVRKLVDNLDVRTKDITAGFSKVTGPALRQYEQLALDARRALDEVNRAVRSIEKNPQQLIFGAKPKVPEYSAR